MIALVIDSISHCFSFKVKVVNVLFYNDNSISKLKPFSDFVALK